MAIENHWLRLLAAVIVVFIVYVFYDQYMRSGTGVAEGMHAGTHPGLNYIGPQHHVIHSLEKQEGGIPAVNIVPSIGNINNPNKAWNDTPTIGMFDGYKGTMAPNYDPPLPGTVTTAAPDGLPATPDNYCAVPTGFLGKIVRAREQGLTSGLFEFEGVELDLGHPGGNQFYDTNGDGCCDTYCRRVVKGGYWSCITPQMVTTQYDAMQPRGTPCTHYGRNSNSKLSPLYE